MSRLGFMSVDDKANVLDKRLKKEKKKKVLCSLCFQDYRRSCLDLRVKHDPSSTGAVSGFSPSLHLF